eukprot:TRINITY_DN91722_c0_g1_i1.p1 TRINITY_DN91722_c0_g1~~TRINITY_DN91722_c0_g1_i1.p1  ORF type:complete len:678 (-),score=128.87 TRINITY_DN91722_c0_g1_i1:57-2060(-)
MAASSPSAFEKLLKELRAVHEQEIEALRAEVNVLQKIRQEHQADKAATERLVAEDNRQGLAAGSAAPPSPVMAVKLPEPRKTTGSRTTMRNSSEVSMLDPNSPLSLRLKAFFTSDTYELAVGITIMANIVVMAADVQYRGLGIGFDLGYRWFDQASEDVWPGGNEALLVLDSIFLGLFTLDLFMSMAVLRWAFFRSGYNLLDILVVATGWLEVVSSFFPIPPTLMRMLRLLKFGRALRAVQLSRVSQSLKILRTCIASSVEMLFWSLCLLGVIQCVFGMMISVLLRPFLEDDTVEVSTRRLVFRYYGTFSATTLSMFETLFANWAVPCRVLVDYVSEWWTVYFIFYRCLIGFAVLNVVNACFVQRTMAVGQQDTELMIDAKEKEKERYGRKLQELFFELDVSGDGLLEWEEFYQLVTDERLRAYMSALEIDWNDLSYLFEVMSNGTGYISIADFTASAARVRGAAKGIDMANLLGVCRRVEDMLQVLSTAHVQDPSQLSPQVEAARRREGRRSVIGLPKGGVFGNGPADCSGSGAPNESGTGFQTLMGAAPVMTEPTPPRQGTFGAGSSPAAAGAGGEANQCDVDAEFKEESVLGDSVLTTLACDPERKVSPGWVNGGEPTPDCKASREVPQSSLEEASAKRLETPRESLPTKLFGRTNSEDSDFNV